MYRFENSGGYIQTIILSSIYFKKNLWWYFIKWYDHINIQFWLWEKMDIFITLFVTYSHNSILHIKTITLNGKLKNKKLSIPPLILCVSYFSFLAFKTFLFSTIIEYQEIYRFNSFQTFYHLWRYSW